jgi:uncharacterized metal-binding protein YceD (DUF177 family)
MSDHPPPYTYPFELASLSDRGAELALSPDPAERARIAAWLDALEVPRLDGTIRLSRLDDGVYSYHAEFTADVVQACVVTLEPVPSHHSGSATRLYRVIAKNPRRSPRNEDIGAAGDDDDAPELLTSSLLDLAAPVLEELSLLLDPYPRAPGVTFEPPKDESKGADSPFAVLAKLKIAPKEAQKSPKKAPPRNKTRPGSCK